MAWNNNLFWILNYNKSFKLRMVECWHDKIVQDSSRFKGKKPRSNDSPVIDFTNFSLDVTPTTDRRRLGAFRTCNISVTALNHLIDVCTARRLQSSCHAWEIRQPQPQRRAGNARSCCAEGNDRSANYLNSWVLLGVGYCWTVSVGGPGSCCPGRTLWFPNPIPVPPQNYFSISPISQLFTIATGINRITLTMENCWI